MESTDNSNERNQQEMKMRYEDEKKRKQYYQRVVSVAISIISMIATITTVALFTHSKKSDVDVIDKDIKRMMDDVANKLAMEATIKALREYKNKMEVDIKEIKKYPSESKLAFKVVEMEASLRDIDTRLKSIEQVILTNPSKALEIPMLRKDMDGYKNEYQVSVISLKHDIERVYDFNKWFLGLLFTMFISIFGLAFTNFMKSKNSKE